jgi:DNA-binding response OmpR family regulator
MARQLQPWVIICDQVLADGDWRDLLRDLQKGQQAPPVIVSSRLADDRLWAEVLNLGGYDLLTKPFHAAEVSRVVRMAARHGGAPGGK